MKKIIKFIIPSIITLLILLVLFYTQDLYPFADNSIVQVDADYQFIPILYRIYDFLHGNGNIIYDDIGLGNNIYISMIIQGSLFSPLSLLLYFTSRDNIVYYFNIIVIVKMCLISLTTYIYINKSFKVSEYYKVLFSVLYAFSGWVLLNYFNIMWLDSLILFPLIIMYLNELLTKGKYLGYVITLSLSLIISYYISYFILLFILFYSFLYIFLKLDKSMIKKTIFKLGIATFIALLISSFSLLPALYQTFNSSRINSSYRRDLIHNFMNKSLYLMLSSIFLVIFTNLLFKYKKDKRNVYIYILLLILFCIGLFVEPINLAIHMGSYWGFPYRYSFIAIFVLMNGSLYFIEKYDFKGYKKWQVIRFILFILFGVLLVYENKLCYDGIIDSQILLDFDDFDVYIDILIMFLIMILMALLAITFKNKKLKYISLSIVSLLQIFVYSGWCMYYNDGYFLTKNSNDLYSNIDIVSSELERYKMGYTSYPPDYGFIYNVNTLDNWLHILPSKEIDTYRKLGYRNTDTCIRSYGGTVLTDWLFNVGYLIDDKLYHNSNMFTLIDDYYGKYYYKYNYNNGFGLVYNDDLEEVDYANLDNFYLQNEMYKDLFNTDYDIIEIKEYEYDSNIYGDKISINFDIEEDGFLYVYLPFETDSITINGFYINYKYSEYIIDLGMFDEDVLIEIDGIDGDYGDIIIGYIKYDDIMNLSTNVSDVVSVDNGYDIEVYNDMNNGYLFLPINNISGLKAYVNGENVEIDSYLDNFVSIKLDNGYNKIEVRYEMPLFKLGIILSMIGFLCLMLFNKIPNNKIILNITYYVYITVCLGFYLYLYGYSMLKYYG